MAQSGYRANLAPQASTRIVRAAFEKQTPAGLTVLTGNRDDNGKYVKHCW